MSDRLSEIKARLVTRDELGIGRGGTAYDEAVREVRWLVAEVERLREDWNRISGTVWQDTLDENKALRQRHAEELEQLREELGHETHEKLTVADSLTSLIRWHRQRHVEAVSLEFALAAARAEVEHLKSELQLVTAPHESVGAVMRAEVEAAFRAGYHAGYHNIGANLSRGNETDNDAAWARREP